MKNYLEYRPGTNLDAEEYGVYPKSVHKASDGQFVYMVRSDVDYLLADGKSAFSGTLVHSTDNRNLILAPLTHENAMVLRQLFPFTKPSPVLKSKRTIGLGDRLGIATPGQLNACAKHDVKPVLAQQSIRELTLTERDFNQVIDCATFAVFREDYQNGFGADGDHLKTDKEVEYALSSGCSMITLDCSEYIHNEFVAMSTEKIFQAYGDGPAYKEEYVDRDFRISNDLIFHCSKEDFARMYLIYGEIIDFIEYIYKKHIAGNNVDFEISIDETATTTSPLQHFFVANELTKRKVRFETIAPRFCGEFQKGIDYIGDLEQFEKEMFQHVAIANKFQYKISVHSGSDKFSIFPAIGRLTKGHFHLKTAGTNWLEAMKLVAMKDPNLYREIHTFALRVFNKAKAYYSVTTDLSKIPDISTLSDEQLPSLFANNDARQLIHITYGLILTQRNQDKSYRFKNRLYADLRKYDKEYAELLEVHIGNHLRLLYSEIPD